MGDAENAKDQAVGAVPALATIKILSLRQLLY
jgi:hypothetical protein